MVLATAANIPIELYSLILDFFTTDIYEDDQFKLNYVQVDKHELSSFALVCREWAVACQPLIFEEVTLRDHEDVDALLDLMDHPHSRVARYIRRIMCSPLVSGPGIPWIHAACIKLPPRLPAFAGFHVLLNGPLAPGKSLPSIQSSAPRQLASGIFRRIGNLVLTDVHLEKFEDLMRVIAHIPSLGVINCDKVTWKNSPSGRLPPPILPLSRHAAGWRVYNMTACTDNGAAVWLASLISPSKTRQLQRENAHALCCVASALVNMVDAVKFPRVRVSNSTRVKCTMGQGDSFDFTVAVPNTIDCLTPRTSVYLMHEDRSQRVHAIAFNFAMHPGSHIPLSNMIGYSEWKTIDEQISTLRDLEVVLLVFDSREDLLLFSSEVVAKMSHLSNSSTLRYMVSNQKPYPELRWSFCTPDTIEADLERGQWITNWKQFCQDD